MGIWGGIQIPSNFETSVASRFRAKKSANEADLKCERGERKVADRRSAGRWSI